MFDEAEKPFRVDIWGFAQSVSDLDRLVGPGESKYIDHDNNVIYWVGSSKLGSDHAKYAAVVTVEGTVYADAPLSNFQYHYAGLGANRDGSHQTDFGWKSTDKGSSWEKNEESEDISGKTITLEVKKFEEAITEENGAEVLATEGEVIFGPKTILCDHSRSFSA